MKIAEWTYIKKFIIWFRNLPEIVQRISIFIPLLVLLGTCWVEAFGFPLIVWYILFFFFGACGLIIIWGLWSISGSIVEDVKKWKIMN
jgi:hypothetical protein